MQLANAPALKLLNFRNEYSKSFRLIYTIYLEKIIGIHKYFVFPTISSYNAGKISREFFAWFSGKINLKCDFMRKFSSFRNFNHFTGTLFIFLLLKQNKRWKNFLYVRKTFQRYFPKKLDNYYAQNKTTFFR